MQLQVSRCSKVFWLDMPVHCALSDVMEISQPFGPLLCEDMRYAGILADVQPAHLL